MVVRADVARELEREIARLLETISLYMNACVSRQHELREKAQRLEAQCRSQGDYQFYEHRIYDLLEEADELQAMILPNASGERPLEAK